jgi:hypothetical protein
MKSLALGLLPGLVVWRTGCGETLPHTVEVTGRVTVEGQPLPAAGIVDFLQT